MNNYVFIFLLCVIGTFMAIGPLGLFDFTSFQAPVYTSVELENLKTQMNNIMTAVETFENAVAEKQKQLQEINKEKKLITESKIVREPEEEEVMTEISVEENKAVPVVLAWTAFHTTHLVNFLQRVTQHCPHKCYYTKNRAFLGNASAIAVHACDLYKQDLPPTRSDQHRVFIMHESPGRPNRRFYQHWGLVNMSVFDVTLSYLQKSDYYYPYGQFVPVEEALPEEFAYDQKEVAKQISIKTEGTYYLGSHCGATSDRDYIIRYLGNFTKFDRYGRCAGKHCDKDCASGLIEKYHFYLALENTVCEEYITEKFFRMFNIIVPITFKRSYLDHLAPSRSFIALDDFCSVQEMGEYLTFLMKNKKEYAKYFTWTKKFVKNHLRNAMCDLCRDLQFHNVTTTEYPNENLWSFMPKTQCLSQYGRKVPLTCEKERRTSFKFDKLPKNSFDLKYGL